MRSLQLALFTISFSLGSLLLSAQVSQYQFCVSSSQMESFRAVVNFKGIDLGEATARRLISNQLRPHLNNDFELRAFDEKCACYSQCPVLSIEPAQGNGVLESTTAGVDNFFSEARAAWDNPAAFLKKAALRVYEILAD